MLRRNRQIKTQIQQVLDAALFGLSFWLSWIVRTNPTVVQRLGLNEVDYSLDRYVWLYFALMFAGPLVLFTQGFYDRPLLSPRRGVVIPLLKGCLITTVGLILVIFFFHVTPARAVPILFGPLSFIFILLKEELLRAGLKSKFARSQWQRKFVLIGTAEETRRMREELQGAPDDGIVVLCELDLNTHPLEELARLLHEHSVNGVIVNARHNYFEKVENAINTCELEGVEVWLVADFFRTQISHTSFDDFHGRPVLVFRTTPEASLQTLVKPVLDFVASLLAILLLSPFFLLCAVLIKLGSRGPVLFRQQRCGLNGQPFTIYKFRTMYVDAEQRKHEFASLNEMSGPVFKIKNDPRVTPIGRILRQRSFDEFPQFFNVLRGEMSLVGPRPLPVDEVRRFDDFAHRRRLSVKPGLTCLWQISGRNEVSDFSDWVRLDLEYIDNWSLWLDFKIIGRTIPVVLTGAGAR
jgi:exopolysaccharide biosynthesis polyprenyl glycosylphosphotransferase